MEEYEWIFHIPEEMNCGIDFKAVERALGFRLFAWQKTWILRKQYRRSGLTTAEALRELLNNMDEEPLMIDEKEYRNVTGKIYLHILLEIYNKLNAAGVKTRKIVIKKRRNK